MTEARHVHGQDGPDYPELRELASTMLSDEPLLALPQDSATAGVTEPAGFAVRLELADLLADDGGELVLDGMGAVELLGAGDVLGTGQTASHVTASGEDVSGFSYLTLQNGMTVYFPPNLDLSVSASDILS